MAEHIIYRRDECGECEGTGINPEVMTKASRKAIRENASMIPVEGFDGVSLVCPKCGGLRVIETAVDADVWLAEWLGKFSQSLELATMEMQSNDVDPVSEA